jgi:hypothetical protein
MAKAGQLKTKIDLLKKKIASKGATIPTERARQLRKRLKRMQRARRTAHAVETKAKGPVKAPEAKEGAAAAPSGQGGTP